MIGSNEISVIILTYNEEIHLERCVNSLKPFVKDIFIVDSFSNDNTRKIAENLGVKFYQNKWINYAKQFQWGLDNCPIKTEWIMRMDADEYIEDKLAIYIKENICNIPDRIKGIYLKRKVFFFNKWMRKGGVYPQILLRIWRHGVGRIEQRWMDEHIVLSDGETVCFNSGDIVDDNKNNFSWWIEKHNNYATREMIDLMNIKYKFMPKDDKLKENNDPQAKIKRLLKEKIYVYLPFGVRPFLYFIFRYFIRLGFLDGFKGFIWHFMQGWWYRMLVDVKCYEFEKKRANNTDVKEIIKSEYGYDI